MAKRLPRLLHPFPRGLLTVRSRILALLLASLFGAPSLLADEWWAWSSIEFWRESKARAWLFLGNRYDFEDGAYIQIASPRFRYEALPWLGLATGQSVLSIENTRTGDRFTQWRPELEINPHYEPVPSLSIELRNRMEWRWNEGQSFTSSRTRHRLQATWTLPHPIGPLTRIFVSDELLSDVHRHQWSENRLIPAGLTFKLGPRTDLDVFYMIFASRAQPHWRRESILGTFLRIRL